MVTAHLPTITVPYLGPDGHDACQINLPSEVVTGGCSLSEVAADQKIQRKQVRPVRSQSSLLGISRHTIASLSKRRRSRSVGSDDDHDDPVRTWGWRRSDRWRGWGRNKGTTSLLFPVLVGNPLAVADSSLYDLCHSLLVYLQHTWCSSLSTC
jgi:hypothetical protein